MGSFLFLFCFLFTKSIALFSCFLCHPYCSKVFSLVGAFRRFPHLLIRSAGNRSPPPKVLFTDSFHPTALFSSFLPLSFSVVPDYVDFFLSDLICLGLPLSLLHKTFAGKSEVFFLQENIFIFLQIPFLLRKLPLVTLHGGGIDRGIFAPLWHSVLLSLLRPF